MRAESKIMTCQNLLKGLALSATVLLTGCVSGPDYVRPESKTPTAWDAALEGGVVSGNADVARWWESVNDPILSDLIAQATAGNLDLRLAEARLREARAARGVTEAAFWPTASLSAGYKLEGTPKQSTSAGSPISGGLSVGPGGLTRNVTVRGRNVTVNRSVSAAGATTGVSLTPGADAPDRTQDLFVAGFDAGWELDLFGGTRRAIEAADAEIQAAEEWLCNVRVSIAAEVALNYIDLRSAQRRLDITRQNIDAQHQSVRLTKARFDAGLNSELDTVRASALLSGTESQLPLLEAAILTAAHRLSVLTGQAPGALRDQLETTGPIPTAPATIPVGLPSELLLRRPDIRAAERELAAATARIGVAVADLYPKFNLTGSLSGKDGDLGSLLSGGARAWSIGPSVNWPILQGGRIRANIEVQNARQEQALTTYEQTILLALEEVENSLVGFAQEQVRRESLLAAVESNRKAVRIANERYVQGLEDFLSVLNAQQQLFESEDRLVQSESFVLANLIVLYKALGGGWDEMAAVAE